VKILAIAAVAAGVLAFAGPSARAEDIVAYQADGDADAAAADARVGALDQAFGKAVSQALNDLLDSDVRRQNKPVLDRELLGHARLWVAKFTVTREVVADDRKQVSVSVRVDRDKLRARLAELVDQLVDDQAIVIFERRRHAQAVDARHLEAERHDQRRVDRGGHERLQSGEDLGAHPLPCADLIDRRRRRRGRNRRSKCGRKRSGRGERLVRVI
jgi:hypothetical protein